MPAAMLTHLYLEQKFLQNSWPSKSLNNYNSKNRLEKAIAPPRPAKGYGQATFCVVHWSIGKGPMAVLG